MSVALILRHHPAITPTPTPLSTISDLNADVSPFRRGKQLPPIFPLITEGRDEYSELGKRGVNA